jgi:hypothetical protein
MRFHNPISTIDPYAAAGHSVTTSALPLAIDTARRIGQDQRSGIPPGKQPARGCPETHELFFILTERALRCSGST